MVHSSNSHVWSRREFIKRSTMAGSAAVLAGGCSPAKQPPNILWIMTDDQRIDSLGCYGSPWATSPNIDALAQSGTLFRHAIAQSPVCAPSRTSILSGKYCHSTGILENRSKVSGTLPALTESFVRHGYQVTNIGKLNMINGDPFPNTIKSPGYGGPAATPFKLKGEFEDRESDFDVITLPDFVIIAGTYPLPEEQTEHGITTTNAIQYIENELQEPFFLRVSMISPHTPVLPPKPYDTLYKPEDIPLPFPTKDEFETKPEIERIRLHRLAGSFGRISRDEMRKSWAAYYGLTASVDHQVGLLMEALQRQQLLDNTIVVFASDQGVQMGEHGIYMKRNFYEQTVLCPLIFSWLGRLPEGKTVDAQVEMLDLLPTLIELAGLPGNTEAQGISLVPLISENTQTGKDAVFSEIDFGTAHAQYPFFTDIESARQIMVRTPEWKLTYFPDLDNPDGALYNLHTDPGETDNLFSSVQYRQIIENLKNMAKDWDQSI